jgi:hypothetical protein
MSKSVCSCAKAETEKTMERKRMIDFMMSYLFKLSQVYFAARSGCRGNGNRYAIERLLFRSKVQDFACGGYVDSHH